MQSIFEIIKGKAGLAPLAGHTDSAFREICKYYGAAFSVSEMVAAAGIFHKKNKSRSLMNFSESERPFGIQLFGKEPDKLARAVEEAAKLQPDFIDFNCGCPAKKVFRSGSGGALMGNPELLKSIMNSMRESTSLPLTIKIRSGIDSENINAVEIAKMAEDCGFQAVTVHPRTVKQGFGGRSDWNVIRMVKEAVTIPVIGNGDIDTKNDADEMLNSTGCDAVMIGRGAMGKPWIFAQINGDLDEDSVPDMRELVIRHYRLMIVKKGEIVGVREMRKHLIWYSKSMPGAAEFRRRIVRLESPEDVISEIENFFSLQVETAES